MNDLTWYAERYSELSQQLSSEEFLDSFVKNLAKKKVSKMWRILLLITKA